MCILHNIKPATATAVARYFSNLLTARNEALERANKDLLASNTKFAQQLEAAYQKVQDIAEKTVEGTSQAKSYAELQKLFIEQTRKGREEKA